MGIDLYLLPVDGDHSPSVFYAHQLLNLHRNAIIHDIREIAEEHALDIPEPISCYLARQPNGEHGYGEATEDPYGDKLQYVLAKHLKPLAKKVGILYDDEPTDRPTAWDRLGDEDETPKKKKAKRLPKIKKTVQEDDYRSPLNRATLAYICALPDDYKIVLYWH